MQPCDRRLPIGDTSLGAGLRGLSTISERASNLLKTFRTIALRKKPPILPYLPEFPALGLHFQRVA